MSHKLILDIDPGLDDALALAFAHAHRGLALQAITTSFGRVALPQATRNALRLCALLGRDELPVCEGVVTPTRKGEWLPDPGLHGQDGLGDWTGDGPLQRGTDPRSAARCIVQLALAHPGEITLMCGGPLSNLVQALRLEPRLPQLLKQVVVAGGCLDAPGDVSPGAEFNLWSDPHAADAVLGAGFQLTVLGLNVSRTAPLPLDWLEHWAAQEPSNPMRQLLWHAARHQSQVQAEEAGLAEGAVRPAIAIAGVLGLVWLLHTELFRLVHGPARVAHDGLAEGQLLLDRHADLGLPPYPQPGWGTDQPAVRAAIHLDAAACLDLVQQTLAPLS
ncbi:nucleoside hydrolase [Hylemonella gracilis str. Niagara R]|uniref:Nucleoside hydrolase n=1 Tax=Hylemonella gracilis str. Niagara R TaxID=1458275 RepID=A0A016XIY8_9BURK|nr:nucleoside hydrolase [Hylemonella gracilis]EYC51178.1 nucleoside hydrolase [Hylemonella gracilis str. Niagara R]